MSYRDASSVSALFIGLDPPGLIGKYRRIVFIRVGIVTQMLIFTDIQLQVSTPLQSKIVCHVQLQGEMREQCNKDDLMKRSNV